MGGCLCVHFQVRGWRLHPWLMHPLSHRVNVISPSCECVLMRVRRPPTADQVLLIFTAVYRVAVCGVFWCPPCGCGGRAHQLPQQHLRFYVCSCPLRRWCLFLKHVCLHMWRMDVHRVILWGVRGHNCAKEHVPACSDKWRRRGSVSRWNIRGDEPVQADLMRISTCTSPFITEFFINEVIITKHLSNPNFKNLDQMSGNVKQISVAPGATSSKDRQRTTATIPFPSLMSITQREGNEDTITEAYLLSLGRE